MRIITSLAPLYCTSDLEMKTPHISIKILLLSYLSLGLAREVRQVADYDYQYYNSAGAPEDGESESQDYNDTYWADLDHEAPVEQRGQTFWRAECRAWNREEIYLQGDKERSPSYR